MNQQDKALEKGNKNKENCFVCGKECPCLCFEISTDYGCLYFCSMKCYNKSNQKYDWDWDFGEYEGHYFECRFGGHFEEKWKEVVKSLNIWRKMALEKHKILHKIGYFKGEGGE